MHVAMPSHGPVSSTSVFKPDILKGQVIFATGVRLTHCPRGLTSNRLAQVSIEASSRHS